MVGSSRAPYIRFSNVEVQYTKHVFGLRGVSLDVARGEFVFFVGRTGAGKSTLLKLLSREIRHTAGTVTLNGRDLGRVGGSGVATLRREMGIVPQDFGLLPRKRVWENVAYAMRAVGHTKREVRRKVPEILEQVQIGHRADAFPHELSGGERQRVAIGRALINNPPLLLADEPTGNLDQEHSLEIMDLLAQLNLRGTTILVASHDLLVIEKMARRVVTLAEGRVVSDAPPFQSAPHESPARSPDAETETESDPETEPVPEPEPLPEPEPIPTPEAAPEPSDRSAPSPPGVLPLFLAPRAEVVDPPSQATESDGEESNRDV